MTQLLLTEIVQPFALVLLAAGVWGFLNWLVRREQ